MGAYMSYVLVPQGHGRTRLLLKVVMRAAGTAGDGTFIVSEVWASREDQAAWEKRLAPALAANGVTAVPRARWVPLIAHHQA